MTDKQEPHLIVTPKKKVPRNVDPNISVRKTNDGTVVYGNRYMEKANGNLYDLKNTVEHVKWRKRQIKLAQRRKEREEQSAREAQEKSE